MLLATRPTIVHYDASSKGYNLSNMALTCIDGGLIHFQRTTTPKQSGTFCFSATSPGVTGGYMNGADVSKLHNTITAAQSTFLGVVNQQVSAISAVSNSAVARLLVTPQTQQRPATT